MFSESTPIVVGTQSNGFAGTKASDNADPKCSHDDGSKPSCDDRKKVDEDLRKDSECKDQEKEVNVNSTNNVNTADNELPFDPNMLALEDVSMFNFSSDDEDDGTVADMNNLDTTIQVSPILTTRIQKYHHLDQVIGDLQSTTQTRKMTKNFEEHRHKGDILLVQIYVDDIIFGLTKKKLCIAFERLMHEKFQMSSMGELTFFLGLQVKQKEDGIFISQDKYVAKILKKFRFTEVKTASTPMETQKPLLKDENGEEVDVHMYRSMIGLLMYLTSSRPDIMFTVRVCARYQVNPKVLHLHVMKRIFRYLKGQPKLGLWYPKDSPFDLVAYTDSDYAEASLDRKSITEGCQFLRCRLISWQCKKQTVVLCSTTMAKTINGEAHIHARVDGKEIVITESSVRRDLQLADEEGIDCLLNFTIFEQLALMGFLQIFLDHQLDGMPTHNRIFSAPSHAKKIFGNMRRSGKGFSGRVTPLFQTMVIQNQSELGEGSLKKDTRIPQHSSPTESVADEAVYKELGNNLVRAATTASSLEAEQGNGGGPRRQETMRNTIAQTRVLDLEQTKTTQKNETGSLKRRVKKLEKRNIFGEDASKHERWINDIDVDKDITLVNDADNEMFDVDDLGGEEVFVAGQNKNVVKEVVNAAQVSTAATTVAITTKEITLAQALEALKTSKPKAKKDCFLRARTELVKGKEKRAGTELVQESTKKQKIYMLVEKKYPLTPPALSMMLEKKLQIDYESGMAYQLCKLIKKQLKKRIVRIKSLLDAVGITVAQVYVNTALINLLTLRNFFSCVKSKKKKLGIRKNYVLWSVKERKKRLAMALDSPFGQQGTTTLVLPKKRSMSSVGDTIVALEFEENLSRPDVTKGTRDIIVGLIFWLMLASLDKTKEGWLHDYTPLGELHQKSNSTDLSKMWTVMMDREMHRYFDIKRRLLEVVTELQTSLNARQEIINKAKINKNAKMVKSVAFFRDQQDKDLKLMN
uniref:Uncharacterized mitochondrial protein AtMg00810-like n=1 Tax=Tanacetum cinerariifolium TaxID=118510 RepID=A0A6L2KAP3_TANCI|nr:uncharacterized mitochondrial protein AtMg00810-like [Tanacetum cinerariifolium]